MGDVTVKLNWAGFNAIRNSAEVVELLEQVGSQIQAAAESGNRFHNDPGEAFRVDTVHNTSRAVTFVSTANIDGMLAEVHDRTLSKALG